jgi:hypothetical protein
MDPFKKLPGYHKAPAGLERQILRLIPKVFLVGTVLIVLPSVITRIWTMDDAPWMVSKFISTIDIYAFALLAVLWTGLFTTGVGAFTVMVMKGPAYVADAYPLPDADKPRTRDCPDDPSGHEPWHGPSKARHETDNRPAARYADRSDNKPNASDKPDA